MLKISISDLFTKTILIGFIFCIVSRSASAQSITNYTFAASSGTFTALTSPTNPALSAGTVDDGYFNAVPIGFDFWYMGTRYTTISASTNGWLTLGANITNATAGNVLATAGAPRPVIAPLWDDLDMQAATNISYKVSGSAPNRVFTIQYLNAQWVFNASGNTISFQVLLHETTGKIDFVYRPEAGSLTNPSASIGITAAATGSGNYLSLNGAGTSPTASSTTETTSINAKPASGQTYAFTPPEPTAPGSLTFSGVATTSMTLNWSDLSSNERGFVIYSSTDGVNYSYASQTAAGATSSAQSGLTIGTTYYWKVYAVSEGGLSTALSGSQATATLWYNSGWQYRKAITIDYTKVSAGAHTNFPVLISITDGDLQSKAQADYDDILFTSSDGSTKLDHEVESYTSGTGALVAWVEVPSLSSSANTVIYMYYGNAAATAQQNITGTWDASFKGVWHLNSAFTDATSNANNGTNTGTIAATGKISGGSGFVRSDGADYITITGLMGSPANATLSGWGTLTSRDATGADLISIGDYLSINVDDVTSGYIGGYYNAGWGLTLSSPKLNPGGTGWHYFVYVFNDVSNVQVLFMDGVQVGSGTYANSISYATLGPNTIIGKHANGNANYDFDGTIDEVRIANASRSAGWVLTEYNNQNSPSTFYSVGTETVTKTFTGTGNFSTAARWTGGVVPVAGENLIIDGACTVDNNVGTDNVAYGTLIIGTATGRTLNWAASGTNRLNVSNVSAAAGASTLDMTNGGTLIIRGDWTSTNLTFTPGTGTIETQATITLPAAYATYNNLTLNNAAATFTAAVNTTLNGSLNITGTLQLAGFSMTVGRLQGAGTITSSSGTPTLTTGNLNISATFSGVIGTGAIALTKNGTGTLTLSGSNTYTGLTTIAAGTLQLGSTSALGTTAGATSVSSGAVLDLNGFNYSSAEGLTLAGTGISSGGCLINSNATAATYAGNIILSTTAPQITANNPITLSGIISGGNISGTNSLTVAGNSTLTGALTLSGNNTYTGFTTINSGALLKIGANNALGAAASNGATDAGDGNSTIINSGGVLDLNGITYTQYEGVRMYGAGFSAAGDGCIINSSSTPAIYSGCVDPWQSASLYIANPVTFNGMVQFRFGNSFTKTGNSTLTLSPTGGDRTSANSVLTISAGTLKLGVNLTETGSTTAYTRISSGAVLDLNGFTCARYLYLNGTGISSGGALINNSSTPATHSGSVILESAGSIVGGTGTIAITGTVTGAGFGLTLGGAAGGSVTNIISGTLTTVTKADAGTWTLSGANTFTGGTTLGAGQLNINHATAVGSGAFTISGGIINNTTAGSITLSNNNTQNWNGDFTFTGTQALNMGTGAVTLSASRQVTVSASTLTVGGIINQSTLHLTKAGSGTLTFGSQAITVNNLTISAGTLTATSGSLNVAGNFSNSGTFTHNSGTVNFNGTSSQTIGGATFNNLTINNTAGVTLTADVTYNAVLTLSSGVVSTSSYNLIGTSTGSVSRTSGHVYGNFKKYIPTGATSKTFEIGDATNYTPVAIAFASVTTAGNLTATTTAADHANIGTSTINPALTANRYWTLTNSGILFTNYNATYTFVAGDLDAGADPTSFIVGQYSGGSWSYPTVGTTTATTTESTGLTGFGDFQLGTLPALVKTWDGGAGTNNWGDAANWNTDGVPASTDDVDLTGANTININVTATTNNLLLNNAGLVLTINSGNTLTVSGNLTLTSGTFNTAAAFPTVSGTVNVANGTVGFTGSGSQTIPAYNYNNLTSTSTGARTLANSGSIGIAGTFTPGTNAYTITGSTIDYNAGGAQTIAAFNYNNLTLSNTGAKTFASGTSGIASALSITGTATANTTTNSSTISYNGSANQTITTLTYYGLNVSSTGGTVTGINTTVTNFSINSGTVDLNTLTLTITGTATYTSGTINNGTVTSTGATSTFAGTTFGATVNATSDNLALNGSVFNSAVILTKNGSTIITSNGGNTFNSTATIASSSSANFTLANTSADIFNGAAVFTNTGTAVLNIAYNSTGNQFNGDVTFNNTGTGSTIRSSGGSLATAAYSGNIVVNNTSTAGIHFGASGGGTTTLAATKTITKGGTGFTTGTLLFRQFTQSGSTAQALTLTGTAVLQIGPSATFNGNVNFTSPQIYLHGGTYNGTASLTKNGVTNNLGNGGNTFNGATTLANSGNAYFATGFTTADIFNADVTVTNTGTGFTALADEAAGTMFNGNIIVNSTNGTGSAGVVFGNGPGTAVTATLAAGKTISVGGTGFTAGRLLLRRFIQSGTTAQSFTLTGTSYALFGPYSTFNGAVNFTSPQVYLNGCTYNGTASITKNGATDNTSTGANIFNAATTITNSGAGFLRLANTTTDDFNSDATFIQTGSGLLQPAYATNCTIAGNLSTAGTSTAITFGSTVTLNGTGAQSIGGPSSTFNNLTISNTGNTVTAGVNSSITGNLSVTSGTFDLGSFTANRLTGGGTLTVSNGAHLKIGSTNTIPSNYTTHSIGATSTIEYSGTNQAVAILNSSQDYGHLAVSGSGTEITAGNITVRNNLSITAGSLNINTYTLKIGGSISNSGTFTASSGTIEMNGSSAQTIPAATFSGNAVKSLTINNTAGVTLGGALSLTDVLTVSNGALAADGYLTLKSTATATARVAPITSVAATPISGNVIAERYVPGRRKYRLITSPVTTSASSTLIAGQEALSIWGNWQNGGVNTTPNVGNHITGGSAGDGFDTGTPNASLFTYDDVNRAYVGHTTANGKNTKYTPLKAGIAYLMFVYGDRRNSVYASNPNNTVLTATGTLKTGDQTYNTSSSIPLSGVTGRYTLVGNPFASAINWATIPRTNVENTYWGWDPNLSSSGGYVTVSVVGGVVIQSPYSGTAGLNQYIQSGQGFFVKTSGASPVMTIREQDKVADFNPLAFRGQNGELPLLAINLQYTSGGTKFLADGVVTAFDDEFSNLVGAEDASKMENSAEGLAITNTAQLLSIDARKMPVNNDTLFLTIARLTKPQYTLQIFAKEMGGSSVIPFLQDSYLNTTQPLSLSDTNQIDFNVDLSIAASFAANRFRIVFQSSVVLPVRFISVKATQKNEDVLVKWDVAEEDGIREYGIERSVDGINFSKVGTVASTGNNTVESYEWLDANPVTGTNYYRIRATEANGSYFLSKVVIVKSEANSPEIKVFPNPIQNRQINLYINEKEKGQYTVMLFDSKGQQVITQIIDHPGGLLNKIISLNKTLAGGIYYLQVTNKNEKYHQAIMMD